SAEKRRDTILPIRLAHLDVVKELAGLRRLALRGLERLGVRLHGAIPIPEVAVNVSELNVQPARRRPVAALELQLEQLLNHVELAELPVDASSLGERFDERRIQLERILKVLQRFHALQKPPVEQSSQPKVILRLLGGVLRGRDALLE